MTEESATSSSGTNSQSNIDYRSVEEIQERFEKVLEPFDATVHKTEKKPEKIPKHLKLENIETVLISLTDQMHIDYSKCVDFTLNNHLRLLLNSLINMEIITKYDGIIDVGREALILRATTPLGDKVVVKAFKRSFIQFKIKLLSKLDEREYRHLVDLGSAREYEILRKCSEIEIPCPEPVRLRSHLVVMEYIPDAIPLDRAELTKEQYKSAYKQIVDCITKSYRLKRIIHGDLNPSNILWKDDQCYFIDFSQSVYLGEEQSMNKFMDSCTMVVEYFKPHLNNIPTASKLYTEITGLTNMEVFTVYTVEMQAKKKFTKEQKLMGEMFTKYKLMYYN